MRIPVDDGSDCALPQYTLLFYSILFYSILGLAWVHTHLEGRGGHGTHGGFRERSERYQRHTLGGG